MKDRILSVKTAPRELEALYRSCPTEFAAGLKDAFAEQPDSEILAVWHERLFFQDSATALPTAPRWRAKDIALTICLGLIAGTLAKLPVLVSGMETEPFIARNLAAIMAGALIIYFCFQRACPPSILAVLGAAFAGTLTFLNLLPAASQSQTVFLACLHAPFFFWSLVGLAFLGASWRDARHRMLYLRYTGEVLVYTTVILLGGVVLTGITLSLFSVIKLDITDWYMSNVVVYGSVAAPIVATLLIDKSSSEQLKITPILARIFTPLFLVMAAAYLVAMLLNRKDLFADRDFLIAFNGLLLVVLGLCVLALSEHQQNTEPGLSDAMTFGLVALTLIINACALSAIVFRLTSYGFTPNRLAVLGANLLAFAHLLGTLFFYVGFLRRKRSIDQTQFWIVRYLPAYTLWSLVVICVFPFVFRFA